MNKGKYILLFICSVGAITLSSKFAQADEVSIFDVQKIQTVNNKPSKNLLNKVNKNQSELDLNLQSKKDKAKEEINNLNLKENKNKYISKIDKEELSIFIEETMKTAREESKKQDEKDASDLAKQKEAERIKKEQEEKAKKEEEEKNKAIEEQKKKNQEEQKQQTESPINPVNKEVNVGSTSGLDMNQTTGTVDIQALANYMSSEVGGDAGTWTRIINAESTGRVNADNGSHYGLFQCDYGTTPPGANLGQQIEGARYKYNSQGFYNAWLRWEG